MSIVKHKSEPRIILNTKHYIPHSRSNAVVRKLLMERLSLGEDKKLTLVCAPAGYGKTTLVSEWALNSGSKRAVAWLSLDEGDNDPTRFLIYLVSSIQTIAPTVGEGIISMLNAPQPPLINWMISKLINDIVTHGKSFTLVLDDYHVVETKAIHAGVTFLLENLPPNMHLVIISRDVPELYVAQLRVRNQMTQLSISDLCFTHIEIAEFLSRVMALDLSAKAVATLETRTEGWVAGLQLAALSLQGQKDANQLIESFSGTHHFVMDYLVEEVLRRQPENIQTFLLYTSILDRMCGSLCDALLFGDEDKAGGGANGSVEGEGQGQAQSQTQSQSQETLEYLQAANLFLIPLDGERKWYRYHHLFADLLRDRLAKRLGDSSGNKQTNLSELQKRASIWYEANGYEIESFKHAAAAHDIKRAVRLIQGGEVPLLFRGGQQPVLKWIQSLPTFVLDEHPVLWINYASAILLSGQTIGVEEKLLSAEAAVKGSEFKATEYKSSETVSPNPDDAVLEILGHMAAIRATLAVTRHDLKEIIAQANFALAHVNPKNLPVRATCSWALGYAYLLQKEYANAQQAYNEAIGISERIGHVVITIMSKIGLGNIFESQNNLYQAETYYQWVIQLEGHEGYPVTCDAYLGMARICYEWNDLDSAKKHLEKAKTLASRIDHTDRIVVCENFEARLKWVKGDGVGALDTLEKASRYARQKGFLHRLSDIAEFQIMIDLQQKNIRAATFLVETQATAYGRIRLHLGTGEYKLALAALDELQKTFVENSWENELLMVLVLKSLALYLQGDVDQAVNSVLKAFEKAELGGIIRLFLDEGEAMRSLLEVIYSRGLMANVTLKILNAFKAEPEKNKREGLNNSEQSLLEPLTERELDVLRLIASGLSNQEIGNTLFLALSTVKGYNQKIFSKLAVQSRTEAAAKARALGLV